MRSFVNRLALASRRTARTRSAWLALVLSAACGHNASTQKDGGVQDGPSGPPDASCFMNPQTHYEIINACTTAQKVFKNTHPPLLGNGDTLPPLP
jgi:hypothetical protein